MWLITIKFKATGATRVYLKSTDLPKFLLLKIKNSKII